MADQKNEAPSRDFVTLKQGAELTGMSRPTLFRAVQRGELTQRREQVNHQERILVSLQELLSWAQAREQAPLFRELGTEQREQPGEQPEPSREQAGEQTELVSEQVPLEAYLATLKLLEDTQDRYLEVQDRAHRAERQLDRLGWELVSYRQALTEHAESLAEREARARQAELALQEVREKDEHARLQQEESLRQLAAEASEKEHLAEQLRLAKARVDWLEQRVPRWVRKMFRAG